MNGLNLRILRYICSLFFIKLLVYLPFAAIFTHHQASSKSIFSESIILQITDNI